MNPYDIRVLETLLYRARIGEIKSLSVHIYPQEGPVEFEWMGDQQPLNAIVNLHFAQVSEILSRKDEPTEDPPMLGNKGKGKH